MDLLALFDELRSIGQNGLRYTDEPTHEERYERILELVSRWYGETFDVNPEEVCGRFREELRRSHVTPAVGAQAALFDNVGNVLVQRRADTGAWGLPGGWVEPNESPAETATRETREETGLVVTPGTLVDVYHLSPEERYGPHGQVVVLYRCEIEGGTLDGNHETVELAFREIDDVDDWQPEHECFARDAKAIRRDSGE